MILAVADVVKRCPLSTPLSPAYSLREALDEIITNKGRHFEEKVVDACGSVFRKGYRFK
ncbi:MAG: hypothetical protein ACUVR0_12020 [Candidatus Aminicenantales bacterium]